MNIPKATGSITHMLCTRLLHTPTQKFASTDTEFAAEGGKKEHTHSVVQLCLGQSHTRCAPYSCAHIRSG
jgi:hypothetical protein